ncbi:hypothetical protein HPB48_017036 [Haemaphysalis longicornis]|uniref:Uncharacterized protein n=1 Tax=Haemaphysalis longicornis TaxID=44386 RepID=A0A9J6FMM9_HAELO|nr:hypothetical protein HPB48_017036 [Haemaphysalis longicornis]
MDILRNRARKKCPATELGESSKHQATLYNLREPLRNAIQTAKDMVTVLSEKIKAFTSYTSKGTKFQLSRNKKGRMANSACLSRHTVLARVAFKEVIRSRYMRTIRSADCLCPFEETVNIAEQATCK